MSGSISLLEVMVSQCFAEIGFSNYTAVTVFIRGINITNTIVFLASLSFNDCKSLSKQYLKDPNFGIVLLN